MDGWTSFCALGDSFTEGMADLRPDGTYRGWADRLAEAMATASGPGFRYANLAVRGKLMRQVATEQVPVAVAMRPALVSVFAGVNDVLRPRVDLPAVTGMFEHAVAELRGAGSDVLLFRGGGASRAAGRGGRLAARIAHLNAVISRAAETYDCLLVDLGVPEVFAHRDMWAEDRLHLSPEGHARVAAIVGEALGLPGDGSWRQPLPPAPRLPWTRARADDLRWAGRYVAPWVVRRVRGRSSGDGRAPKRPDLEVVTRNPGV